MSIAVFYVNAVSGSAMVNLFDNGDLLLALERADQLRRLGMLHVSVSTENPDSVGSPGVTSVEDGKTLDEHEHQQV
jgi:MoaA/NifB/PqqE/SkfB family radical SAM enzyme